MKSAVRLCFRTVPCGWTWGSGIVSTVWPWFPHCPCRAPCHLLFRPPAGSRALFTTASPTEWTLFFLSILTHGVLLVLGVHIAIQQLHTSPCAHRGTGWTVTHVNFCQSGGETGSVCCHWHFSSFEWGGTSFHGFKDFVFKSFSCLLLVFLYNFFFCLSIQKGFLYIRGIFSFFCGTCCKYFLPLIICHKYFLMVFLPCQRFVYFLKSLLSVFYCI